MKQTPPKGMNTMPVHVHLGIISEDRRITVLVLKTWLPTGFTPDFLDFPDIDPEKQLPVLEDLGIAIDFKVSAQSWDYGRNIAVLYLQPIEVHPRLSEESVGLAIGLLRHAGWDYKDPEAKQWSQRWTDLQSDMAKQHSPSCSHHPHGPHPSTMPQAGVSPLFGQVAPQLFTFGPHGLQAVPHGGAPGMTGLPPGLLGGLVQQMSEQFDPADTLEEEARRRRRKAKRDKKNKKPGEPDNGGEESGGASPVGPQG